jgi:hypothetical protein
MTKNGYPQSGTRTPEAKARREAHWRGVLEQWRASALPKTEFARREQISPDVLSWWQAELHKRDLANRRKSSASTAARSRWRAAPRSPTLVPVRVVESPPPPSPATIEILAGGHTVRVRPGFDAETLRRLVAVLENRP